MKTLVVGDGGREHAMAWKLATSPSVEAVYIAPGNAGTAQMAGVENIAAPTHGELLEFAQDKKIDFTVVGPEQPLSEGIVDLFRAHGAKIVGPAKAAARLETSKAFAKQFMLRMGIRTGDFCVFNDPALAKDFLHTQDPPYVIKADGLAAGKGVSICNTYEEACSCAEEMLMGKFGASSMNIVVEDCLKGEEMSYFVLSDGKRIVPFGSGRDYKRLLDGGQGPNTGGMGAVSPAPAITPELERRIMEELAMPTLEGMRNEGTPYTGFLYLGLMIRDGVPYVLEYNCRFGDPECQVVLPRLRSDFAELLAWSSACEDAEPPKPEWDEISAAGVVLATQGYATDHVASGVIRSAGKGLLFHAKTAAGSSEGEYTHKGGRALCAVGTGKDISEACKSAYALASSIEFPGGHYRQDIGQKTEA